MSDFDNRLNEVLGHLTEPLTEAGPPAMMPSQRMGALATVLSVLRNAKEKYPNPETQQAIKEIRDAIVMKLGGD